jgi:hypothetical protein
MNNKPRRKRDLAAAQRGLIVQRVLVDDWTPKEAGALFGIDEQSVARWVAAYQRHGMAALRGAEAVSGGPRRWIEYCFWWVGVRVRGGVVAKRPVARRGDGSGAPANPTRHWRWN